MTRPEDRGAGTVDRPLTDAQERALIALASSLDFWGDDFWDKPCRDARTLLRLGDLGLAELRFHPTMHTQARITPAGLELCRSMGD